MPKKKRPGKTEKAGSTVIPFPAQADSVEGFALRRGRKPSGDVDVVIHQEELEMERILARRAHEALKELRLLRENLLWRFLEYGHVEPGARSIEALQVSTEARQTKGSSFYRLKVT